MIKKNKQNILSYNQNYFLKNNYFNFVIYSSNILNNFRSLHTNTEFRAGNAQNLLQKIENLKDQTSKINTNLSSLNKDFTTNYIKNNKLNKSEFKNNVRQEIKLPLSYYESILKFSDLLQSMKLNASKTTLKVENLNPVANSIFNDNLLKAKEIKLIPNYVSNPKAERSGLFLSVNTLKDYFYNLNKIVTTFNECGGKGKLNESKDLISNKYLTEKNKANNYKIRHYLNLLTKFDYNLSTSHYDFFQFKKSNKILFAMEKASEFLNLSFLSKGCLISKPVFNIVYSHNKGLTEENGFNLSDINSKVNKVNSIKTKIIIHLFYYVKTNPYKTNSLELNVNTTSLIQSPVKDKYITTIFNDKFLYISDYLSKLFKADIEFELVRLYQPYQDSNILVQYLNNNSYNSKFIKITNKLFKKINIYKKNLGLVPSSQEIKNGNPLNMSLLNEDVSFPSGISGVNIKLAGRSVNEKIIPRFTVKRAQRGNFSRLNTKMIEKSMYTDKSKKGAFNFSVRLSHIFR